MKILRSAYKALPMRKPNKIIAVSTNGNHRKLEATGVVDFVIDDFRDERLIQLFS